MRFPRPLARAAACLAAGLLVAVSLVSCGGGTYQVHTFAPARLLSFGDENSLLTSDGEKYSVNGISTSTNQEDCTVNPMWFQLLAISYNVIYPECNPAGDLSPTAHSFAAVDATLDDVQRQLDTFAASDSFTTDDLVTLYVGVHDLLNLYAGASGVDQTADLLVQMKALGVQYGNLVNSVSNAGAKVLVLTIPDMGDSPFAVAEMQRGDFDRAHLLSQMSDAYNRAMRSTIINDGSRIGLVLVDDIVHGAARSPSAFGLTSYNIAACLDTAPLPSCTSDASDIREDDTQSPPVANAQFYLWADATHLGITANNSIGQRAASLAHSLPF